MFCQFCGAQIESAAGTCVQCGRHPPSPNNEPTRDVATDLRVSAADTIDVVKKLALDPVGRLAAAFAGLGTERALRVGVALCFIFAVAVSAGSMLGAQHWLGEFNVYVWGGPSFGGFIKIAFKLLVVPAAMVAVLFGVRNLLKVEGSLASDVFIVGASLAPLALAMPLAGLVGPGNFEIAMLVILFAMTYLVLLLHAGLTLIGGLTERAAVPTVPVVIILSTWLCKVVFAASL